MAGQFSIRRGRGRAGDGGTGTGQATLFVVSTYDDGAVPPRNSIEFYPIMINAGVPGELGTWDNGGHAYVILQGHGDEAAEWLPRFEKWMRGRRLLGK